MLRIIRTSALIASIGIMAAYLPRPALAFNAPGDSCAGLVAADNVEISAAGNIIKCVGNVWTIVSQPGGGSGITALTGNVTASGSGSVVATIAPKAVTYAKLQDTTADSVLLGRGAGTAGTVQELTIGSGLSLTGTTLSAPVNGITALTGNVTASGTGSVAATIAAKAVTYAKIQDTAAASVLLGRGAGTAGTVQELTVGSGLSLTGTTLSAPVSGITALTGDVTASGTGSAAATIAAKAVTYAKIQDTAAASVLLGRGAGTAGAVQELAVGSGLSLSGTTLSALGTAAAGSAGQVQFNNGSNAFAGDSKLFWDNTNKFLGVGTNSPGAKLQLEGTDELLRLSQPGNAYAHSPYITWQQNGVRQAYMGWGTPGSSFEIAAENNNALTFLTGGAVRMQIAANGLIGFNTGAIAGNRLYVIAGSGENGITATSSGATTAIYGSNNASGGYAVLGQNTAANTSGVLGAGNGFGVYCAAGRCGGVANWENVSDARLKERVLDLPNERGLELVTQLRPVTYHWRDKERDAEEGQQIGFIAQEVEKLYPEMVHVDPINTMRTMAYSEITIPLVKAVQQLKAENDALRAENEDVRARVEALSRSFEAYKAAHP